jgi:peptidoglycan LD-endopeptidase CwlK
MSSRSLDTLHAKFRPLVDMWLSDLDAAGMIALITCTFRSVAEQEQLYCIGRTVPGQKCIPIIRPMGLTVTNARAGQSAHQYGLAIDFVPMNCGKPDWSGKSDLWNRSIKMAQTRGMESLRPMESAHLQYPNWRSIAGV